MASAVTLLHIPDDVWREYILPSLLTQRSTCENARILSSIRASNKRLLELVAVKFHPCRFRYGTPYCQTHEPLFSYFHSIVVSLTAGNSFGHLDHITFRNAFEREIFWSFVQNRIRSNDAATPNYIQVLRLYKDCCHSGISRRIERVPQAQQMRRSHTEE